MTAGTGASELGAHVLIDVWWMLWERPRQHAGNCFLNPCRWLQRTNVRELCLGSWIWKLWLNKLFEEVRPNFPFWNFCFDFLYCDQQQANFCGEEEKKRTISEQLQPITRMELGKREGCLPHGKEFRQPLFCKPPGAEAWKMEQGSPRQRCTLTPETAKRKS